MYLSFLQRQKSRYAELDFEVNVVWILSNLNIIDK